jgi:2-methylisocitrate lyase-like PEP mutase family enzyme
MVEEATVTRTQAEKGDIFYELHRRATAFVIPNPWDTGTATLLEKLGFEALATTSAGYAFSMGKPDGAIGREESIAHAAAIASATNLPVSADLENGFGDSPQAVADTITQAAKAGLAGASIEDVPSHEKQVVYDQEHAAERIRAAAEVVRRLPFRFTLTARAENYLVGKPDLKDTIARLQAYQEAGADVLYAPGLTFSRDIATLVRSLDRPVNVIMGLAGLQLSVSELSAIGVKRISVGSALSRAALGAFLRAAKEMRDHGTFTFGKDAVPYSEINTMFSG